MGPSTLTLLDQRQEDFSKNRSFWVDYFLIWLHTTNHCYDKKSHLTKGLARSRSSYFTDRNRSFHHPLVEPMPPLYEYPSRREFHAIALHPKFHRI